MPKKEGSRKEVGRMGVASVSFFWGGIVDCLGFSLKLGDGWRHWKVYSCLGGGRMRACSHFFGESLIAKSRLKPSS